MGKCTHRIKQGQLWTNAGTGACTKLYIYKKDNSLEEKAMQAVFMALKIGFTPKSASYDFAVDRCWPGVGIALDCG